MTKYSTHYYGDPTKWEKGKVIEKEQLAVERLGNHTLIHPHKFDEECGDLTHIRISPGKEPEETQLRTETVMPIKTSDHGPKTNTTVGKISFKDRRTRAVAILDYLAKNEVTSSSGRATDILMGKLPVSLIAGKAGALLTKSAFSKLLQEMEEWGWIKREVNVNGRKTYSLSLGDNPPVDWAPATTKARPQPDPDQTAELYERTAEKDLVVSESSYDDEARAGGIRPGRLAARLEKLEEQQRSYIPALVEEGVVAGMQGWFSQLVVAMGYQPKQEEDQQVVEELVQRLSDALALQVSLREDLRAERQSNIAAREELNIALRKQYATRDTSPVQASELPEAWRQLARHAISNGWTIGRTGGGHLLWKSPSGYRYFSSSTSSDYRAVRNARAGMEKQGLPKE